MSPFQIQKKQYLYAALFGCVGLCVIGALVWSLEEAPQPVPSDAIQETQIMTAGARINPQEVWVDRLEGENKLTQQKIDALEKLMLSSVQSTGDSQDKIERLEQELREMREQKHSSKTDSVFPTFSGETGNTSVEMRGGIRKMTLNLSNMNFPSTSHGASQTHTKTSQKSPSIPENTLPAGTFTKAILLGGVDASTAISASSDPRPVLLRITDAGTLPRKFCSDLKDCHVLASAYGDLSSERVYMRLEKLTCTHRLTGEITETQAVGYISGEDGKAGVRGVVADRAGPVIRNSLIGGFLSGMGKFFESQHNTFPVMPFGPSGVISAQKMLQSGAISGTSHALDKYAEFFIKRAEQLQPVLQVAAGREVSIVFTQGTRLGEESARKTLSKIRLHSREQAKKLEDTKENESSGSEDPFHASWLTNVPSTQGISE